MAGLLGSDWDQYLPADLQDEAFGDLSRRMQYQPMDFRKLLDAGAIRITQPSGTDEEGFSLVSKWNDRLDDSATRKWADKPEIYKTALNAFKENNDFLYDGKYRQILWSAKELGLKPQDVFMKKRRDDAGLLGGE